MDVTAIDAVLSFDCRSRSAFAEATMRFTVDDEGPHVFDLRQEIDEARLDGERIDPLSLAHLDLGGGPDAHVRLVGNDHALAPGPHELTLRYALDTPSAGEALPLGWTRNAPGVVFDLWMSDLHPGRYLEMWIPAPLCHDRFALSVEVAIEGTGQPHLVFANGTLEGTGVTYADHFTSLSPMLVIAPEARVELIDSQGVCVFKLAGPEIDLDSCHGLVRECLEHDRDAFGDYVHGDRFLAYLWGSTRGMEYDGATTASVGSLEHEVFHSWFGRGVKPATAADGWIDEAFTTWYTAGPPRARRFEEPFDADEPPVVLRPDSPWARYTPREAYTAGARLFAGFAALIGVDGVVAAMRSLYESHAGGFVSTDDLQATMSEACGRDLGREFGRWVHGRDS